MADTPRPSVELGQRRLGAWRADPLFIGRHFVASKVSVDQYFSV